MMRCQILCRNSAVIGLSATYRSKAKKGPTGITNNRHLVPLCCVKYWGGGGGGGLLVCWFFLSKPKVIASRKETLGLKLVGACILPLFTFIEGKVEYSTSSLEQLFREFNKYI